MDPDFYYINENISNKMYLFNSMKHKFIQRYNYSHLNKSLSGLKLDQGTESLLRYNPFNEVKNGVK